MKVELNEAQRIEKEKSMKTIKTILVFVILLILLIGCLIGGILYIKAKDFKVYVNGKTYTSKAANIFIVEDGKIYVAIKDFATFLGYKTANGEYKKYSEDSSSCYLESSNEVATYTADSDTMYKIITSEEGSDYEYFTLDEPVKVINNKLYTTAEGIAIGSATYVNYDAANNAVNIYTLDGLASIYAKNIRGATVTDKDELYSNKKALLYGLVITKDEDGTYGVQDTTGKEIIGTKYSSIKFLESYQEFIVKTPEGKMGIVGIDGTTKIKPEYEDIKQIDKENGLYLVSNNKKYGVINKNGKTILYTEYDEIGLDTEKFDNDNIKNIYLIYDNCIPVKKGGKWGLMSKYGSSITNIEYDSFGCEVGTSATTGASNLLLIPEYEAIVVCKNNLYGLITASGNKLIEVTCKDFYSLQDLGKTIYYCTWYPSPSEKLTYNIIDYLIGRHIYPVDSATDTSEENATNTVTNEDTSNEEVNNTNTTFNTTD